MMVADTKCVCMFVCTGIKVEVSNLSGSFHVHLHERADSQPRTTSQSYCLNSITLKPTTTFKQHSLSSDPLGDDWFSQIHMIGQCG